MGPGNRPLDMEWLEDFLALAATGNFSRAAEARAIAQPAFSRHIRSLEEWIGVDLVDRSAHPAELTPAGKQFHPLLVDVLASLEAARIKARGAHDQSAASLRFASTHALSLYFFPRWLASLEARLRFGPVQTMSHSFQGCEDLMLQRRVQFVLCYGDASVTSRLDEGGYPVARLGDDVLVPVSAPAPGGTPVHRVGGGGMLPVLSYSDDSGVGRIMRGHLSAIFGKTASDRTVEGVSLVFTSPNSILLKAMALEGRGVAWLPLTMAKEELAAGTLIDAADGGLRVPLEVRLYRQRTEMAPIAETLWTLVQAPAGH